MDEPTASLTQQEQQLLFGVVRELRSSGVGVIYISHRLEEIFALADRVTVLRDGESVGTRDIRSRVGDPQQPGSSSISDSHADIPRYGSSSHSRGLTESELIHMMVGREVSQIYPPPESTPGEVVLSLKNLGCTFSGVRDVTIDFRAGEVVGLAGLIGAGRTELARVLFGITPADSGEIILNGERVPIKSPQEAVAHGIAYVPEDRRRHGIILEMPVAANMTMAIHPKIFRGMWLRFQEERRLASDFIRKLDVRTAGPDALGSSLSGGNQQKVSLARWLATKPRLLILDEPTQGVDIGAKAEIHKIIRRLAGEGMAVLLISSDLPEVLGMSDRIAIMHGGTIVTVLSGNSDAHEVMAAALGQRDSIATANLKMP